ncbi:GGDEF domain-containing protein [Sphingomonas sp. JC676]|nr:GGDEF domain-containing protein [Sphingomonas sp. JC676]
MRLPVFGLGLIFVGVASLAARELDDSLLAALAGLGGFVTLARLFVLELYRRARPVLGVTALARWEQRYAAGNYAFALLLGVLNARVLTYHYPLLHLITVSLVFSFGAGIVSRISVRPRICVASLLLATVPTIAALGWHAGAAHETVLHGELFAIEAILVLMITSLSLQTVAHLYSSSVEHHTARHDMAQLAKHDPLTGLANRLLLRERLQASRAARGKDRLAVHFIDLDGFKAINDNQGHPAGDAVLVEVARRLASMLRAEDTVARLGGDEFVVIQGSIDHADQAEMLARRIIRNLSVPYSIDGKTLGLSASIGIALSPDAGDDLERLLGCADAALYRAKAAGKGRAAFCTEEDSAQAELHPPGAVMRA